MAALPPDNTPRFKVEYQNLTVVHELLIRSNQSPVSIGVQVDAFFTALGPLISPTVIGTVYFAPSGSSVFNPVTTGIEGNNYGSAGAPTEAKAWYVNFVGRSTSGRRARLFVFGASLLAGNYRWGPGENAAVDAAITVLQTFSAPWQAIDGTTPVWKNYANAGVNDFIAKHLR